jgi:hypothetical protein
VPRCIPVLLLQSRIHLGPCKCSLVLVITVIRVSIGRQGSLRVSTTGPESFRESHNFTNLNTQRVHINELRTVMFGLSKWLGKCCLSSREMDSVVSCAAVNTFPSCLTDRGGGYTVELRKA